MFVIECMVSVSIAARVELPTLDLVDWVVRRKKSLAQREMLQNGSKIELTLAELSSLLLELLDGTLVDTSALVDQVTGGGRLAGIDVADDDDVNVKLDNKRPVSIQCNRRRYTLNLTFSFPICDQSTSSVARAQEGKRAKSVRVSEKFWVAQIQITGSDDSHVGQDRYDAE